MRAGIQALPLHPVLIMDLILPIGTGRSRQNFVPMWPDFVLLWPGFCPRLARVCPGLP